MDVNKITLGGRLTADPEVRITPGKQLAVASFSVAVNRPKGKDATESKVDFINCVAFGKIGEVIGTYFKKGNNILLFGSLNIDRYTDKEGNNRLASKVIVSEFHFVDSKSSSNSGEKEIPAKKTDEKTEGKQEPVETMTEEFDSEDDLPF